MKLTRNPLHPKPEPGSAVPSTAEETADERVKAAGGQSCGLRLVSFPQKGRGSKWRWTLFLTQDSQAEILTIGWEDAEKMHDHMGHKGVNSSGY